MSFHLGKPILAMIVLGALSGAALCLRPSQQKRADLVVWVFADQHHDTYTSRDAEGKSLAQRYTDRTGLSVDVKMISWRALSVRLVSMFNADLRGEEVPDLVEVELSQAGKFFRPPVDEVGFLRLNERLEQSGWYDRIIKARFSPWSKGDVIFGVPHDVHPVTLTYRKDLFEEAGVDLPAANTWAKFHEACLKFQEFWRKRGVLNRWAIELPQADSSFLQAMILQRGINLIEKSGQIRLNDPKVARTLAAYAEMAAGPRQIGSEVSSGDFVFSQDLTSGAVCALWTPDWRVASLKKYGPRVEGKVAMIPLPRFEPGDAPTSTWGGTMIAIPKRSKNHDAAFALIEQLYLRPEVLDAQQRANVQILPPVISMWDDRRYQNPDPFYGGQYVDRLFIELAQKIPPKVVMPETAVANATLTYAMCKAVAQVKDSGSAGLVEACQRWLDEGAKDLAARIEHGKFSD